MSFLPEKGRSKALVSALSIAFFLIQSVSVSNAQQSETGNVCVEDYGGASCTANDMDIGVGSIIQEVEPCTSVGDTGEYIFQFEFDSNAQTRYDVGVYVALDGGSGNTGDMCYHSLLDPVIPPATHNPDGGPYFNDDGDSC